jgi:hypothetical protein
MPIGSTIYVRADHRCFRLAKKDAVSNELHGGVSARNLKK